MRNSKDLILAVFFSTECHEACKDGCDGPGTDKCVDCIAGWKLIDGTGCVGKLSVVI